MRDIAIEDTFDVKFVTTAADTGAPTQLAGTPVVSAYVGNSITQITAGITLSVDFDAVTGLNNARVVATAANGYTDNTNVALVITTGTVGGTSVVGYVIENFTIGRGAAYRRLGAPAGASVSADIAAVKVDTAAILVDTGTTLDARIPAALVGGRMDASVGAMAANVVTATAIAADAITDAKVAADVTIASVTGAVGSVTGAVGSVAAGGIAATSFAAGAIDAAAIANGAIDAATFAAGAIDAGAIAADAITAAKIATGAIDADALSLDAVNEIADAWLDRDMSIGTDSGSPTVRTPRQSMRALRNKVSIAAGTATVTKEDDTTTSWTAAVTTTAGDPISSIDPASA